MPFTPESINQAIQINEIPPKKGEEGILHPIQLGNNRYYAKEWRGKNFGNDSISYEDESKKNSRFPVLA